MTLAHAASRLLTIPGTAAFIGIDRTTVYQQIRAGKIATVSTHDGRKLVTVAEATRYRDHHAGRPGRRAASDAG